MEQKPTYYQGLLLKRRGLDPKDYVVVKALYGSVWFRNVHTGTIKIIDKKN